MIARRLLVALCSLFALGGCGGDDPAPAPPASPSSSSSVNEPTQPAAVAEVPVGQNHTDGFDADLFYYTDQGSGFFPMKVVRALNDSVTGRPYLENLERFGLVPGEVSDRNPEGFPVGIVTNTIDVDGHEVEMFGFTCAACHTSDIRYNGKTIRVDGGSGLFWVDNLGDAIGNSLKATLEDPAEFIEFIGRFRKHSQSDSGLLAKIETLIEREENSALGKVLNKYLEDSAKKLLQEITSAGAAVKEDVEEDSNRIKSFVDELLPKDFAENSPLAGLTSSDKEKHLFACFQDLDQTLANIRYRLNFLKIRGWLAEPGHRLSAGYGRADDFGTARVELFAGWNKKNMLPVNAPVSTPPLWKIDSYAWLHWNANTNSVIQRSIGESIGVGATFNAETFATSVNIVGQMHMEQQLQKITAPVWPDDLLGKPDPDKVAKGRELYAEHCAKCHDPAGVDDKGLIDFHLYTLEEIGTDKADAVNFDQPVYRADDTTVTFASAIAALLEELQETAKAGMSPENQTLMEELEKDRVPVKWRDTLQATGGPVYPAKPLEGVWATAPYLHNGSVPTIYHLLLPVDQRPAKFSVGQKDYDPVHVGFDIEPAGFTLDPGMPSFELDTTVDGNRNTGHEYGTDLSEEDRMALVEYMKVHKDPPPPAGGGEN